MIEVQIVEGRLADIVVNGLTSLKPEFVEERIRLGAGPPLNVNDLREQIQLLLLDPAIDRINARLGPGLGRGEGRLEVIERDAIRFDFASALDDGDAARVCGARRPQLAASTASANAEALGFARPVAELDRRGLQPRLRPRLPVLRRPFCATPPVAPRRRDRDLVEASSASVSQTTPSPRAPA